MNDINAISGYPHAALGDWSPVFPDGRIDRLYLHWSAGNYHDVFPAYHFCVALNGENKVVVVQTNRIEANMCDVREDPQKPYAAHTRGRNSFALGLSIMGMRGATPNDFGPFALTKALIDGLCIASARLAEFYEIPIDADHILSHAEAAVADGYFGTSDNERWDIARLQAAPHPLMPVEAAQTGNRLRSRIAEV